MCREHYNGNNQPLNDECYYCHRKGHFKRDCAALKRAQRNNAELASIARRRHGKRRGDTVKIRKVDANEVHSACLKQQLLLPECLLERERVLIGLHNDAGHQALERTEALVRARCYWPRMHDHIKQWIIKCQRCTVAKFPHCKVRTPLGRLHASNPSRAEKFCRKSTWPTTSDHSTIQGLQLKGRRDALKKNVAERHAEHLHQRRPDASEICLAVQGAISETGETVDRLLVL